MEIGFVFKNNDIILTVLRFDGSERVNVALLKRHSDNMYITVRDVSRDRENAYSWAWGHYFTEPQLSLAVADYEQRRGELYR